MKKVLLGIPSYKTVSSLSFKHHMAFLADGLLNGTIATFQIEPDMYVPLARNKMCRTAIKLWEYGKISHVFFVDDDMHIPPHGLTELLEREYPVEGGLCFTRKLEPIAFNFRENEIEAIKSVPEMGLVQVDGVCAGALLVECSVLKKMQEKYNDEWWFQSAFETNENEKRTFVGEDVFFFRRLKEMGIRSMLNCNVQCDHSGIGVTNYGMYKILKSGQIDVGIAMGMEEKPSSTTIKGDIGISKEV